MSERKTGATAKQIGTAFKRREEFGRHTVAIIDNASYLVSPDERIIALDDLKLLRDAALVVSDNVTEAEAFLSRIDALIAGDDR